MTINYPRAMAAYKVGAEGGRAGCQYQIGFMYCYGFGVAVDYKQARPWIEMAAAQDQPNAVGTLGSMIWKGRGATPSFRRARELYKRAIILGAGSNAVSSMDNLTRAIQQVS